MVRTVYVTAVQPYKGTAPPVSVPQYSRARPKKGWMAGRKLFFTRTSLRSYSYEGRDQAGTHFVFPTASWWADVGLEEITSLP